eukprot:3640186-Alexandrium_andersonii.AAC.1
MLSSGDRRRTPSSTACSAGFGRSASSHCSSAMGRREGALPGPALPWRGPPPGWPEASRTLWASVGPLWSRQ